MGRDVVEPFMIATRWAIRCYIYRFVPKTICVFGNSSAEPGTPDYEEARELGTVLALHARPRPGGFRETLR